MKVYLAGTPGSKKRELQVMSRIKKRLVSFYDIDDLTDKHFQRRAFKMIKERRKKNGNCRNFSKYRRGS